MNPSTSLSVPATAIAWWRVPHMWLVVGGPLIVVVASLFMVAIAVTHADPVLDKKVFERDRAAAAALQGQAKDDALIQLQPAHQARNHAASPVLPQEH